jgi:hypothetical protein
MSNEQLLFKLLEALRQWKCPACGGSGTYLQRGWKHGVFRSETVPCHKCDGHGLNPIAYAAIQLAEGN